VADAKLAQADANQAWITAKDSADKQFAVTDAANWQGMISGEANAASAFTIADDAATAAESNAGAQAEADHMKADAQADSDKGTSDATASGGFEESEANSAATEIGTLDNSLGNTPWATYESDLAQAKATWETTAVSDEEQFARDEGAAEVQYATDDGTAFVAEVKAMTGNDLSGGTGTSAGDTIAGADAGLASTVAGDEQTYGGRKALSWQNLRL
jgi:hypothetical protein